MKNIYKINKIKGNTAVSVLCLFLAALMLLSGCTNGSGGGDTATTTTTTKKDDSTPVTPPSSITGKFEAQSVAIGQKLIISCPTDSKCTFFLTTTAAEIVENEFDGEKSVSTVTVLGKIPGSATLVGVSEKGSVSHLSVNVYAPAGEGETLDRTVNA